MEPLSGPFEITTSLVDELLSKELNVPSEYVHSDIVITCASIAEKHNVSQNSISTILWLVGKRAGISSITKDKFRIFTFEEAMKIVEFTVRLSREAINRPVESIVRRVGLKMNVANLGNPKSYYDEGFAEGEMLGKKKLLQNKQITDESAVASVDHVPAVASEVNASQVLEIKGLQEKLVQIKDRIPDSLAEAIVNFEFDTNHENLIKLTDSLIVEHHKLAEDISVQDIKEIVMIIYCNSRNDSSTSIGNWRLENYPIYLEYMHVHDLIDSVYEARWKAINYISGNPHYTDDAEFRDSIVFNLKARDVDIKIEGASPDDTKPQAPEEYYSGLRDVVMNMKWDEEIRIINSIGGLIEILAPKLSSAEVGTFDEIITKYPLDSIVHFRLNPNIFTLTRLIDSLLGVYAEYFTRQNKLRLEKDSQTDPRWIQGVVEAIYNSYAAEVQSNGQLVETFDVFSNRPDIALEQTIASMSIQKEGKYYRSWNYVQYKFTHLSK